MIIPTFDLGSFMMGVAVALVVRRLLYKAVR